MKFFNTIESLLDGIYKELDEQFDYKSHFKLKDGQNGKNIFYFLNGNIFFEHLYSIKKYVQGNSLEVISNIVLNLNGKKILIAEKRANSLYNVDYDVRNIVGKYFIENIHLFLNDMSKEFNDIFQNPEIKRKFEYNIKDEENNKNKQEKIEKKFFVKVRLSDLKGWMVKLDDKKISKCREWNKNGAEMVLENTPIRGVRKKRVVGRCSTGNKLIEYVDPRGFIIEVNVADDLLFQEELLNAGLNMETAEIVWDLSKAKPRPVIFNPEKITFIGKDYYKDEEEINQFIVVKNGLIYGGQYLLSNKRIFGKTNYLILIDIKNFEIIIDTKENIFNKYLMQYASNLSYISAFYDQFNNELDLKINTELTKLGLPLFQINDSGYDYKNVFKDLESYLNYDELKFIIF